MRATLVLLFGATLAAALYWISLADGSPAAHGTIPGASTPRDAETRVTETSPGLNRLGGTDSTEASRGGPALTSHALGKLLTGPIRPTEPLFLIASCGPAVLSDGVPPT